MSVKLTQFYTIFKRLNTKIVIYFISFAFLPLLIFSILGYYLNKDLISRINEDHLHSINTSYANELNLYFELKNKVLSKALSEYKSSEKTGSLLEFLKDNASLNKEFVHIYTGPKNRHLADPKGQDSELPAESDMDLYFNTSAGKIAATFPGIELEELLTINVKDMQNYVYFLNSKKIIGDLSQGKPDITISGLSDILGHSGYQSENGLIISSFDHLYAYTWLESDQAVLLTRINAQSFYAELNSFRDKIWLANIFFAFILIILAIISSRRITKPVHKLIEATQQIRQGKLDKRIVLKSNDDIEILANEFELMRQRLQESYSGMEDKIKKRTRELQQAQAQISHQEKMASLGMMAAGIAHEIGNPLTSISSMVQVIKRKNTDAQTTEYVPIILKNIERISRIVREMVDFSRPSSYEEAPPDVNEIIKSAVGILRYDRRSKNLNYHLDLGSNLPKTVLVSDHLLQVFLNILINAVDASEGFGDQISVQSYLKVNTIYVNIADQGCGIPQKIQNKIFEPFYTTKDVGKGTGLGLTVTYGFIKKLNGDISVKSTPGKGSSFLITIPIKAKIEE
jgi:signal transduction histidine kinase